MAKPPTAAELHWTGGLVFRATSAATSIIIDGDSREGPSPVQMLAMSLAGCMAADVVYILTKRRQPVRALRAAIIAERAQDNPHRVTRVTLRFTVEGQIPPEAIDRAIALSHDKYCSVWHSMRQDIALTMAFDVVE